MSSNSYSYVWNNPLRWVDPSGYDPTPPVFDDIDIREVPAHSWRVIYQLRGESVFIVTLVHRRRAPAPEDLRS